MIVSPLQRGIQAAGLQVLLNLALPLGCHELLEPLRKPGELGRGKVGDQGLKFFHTHRKSIRGACRSEKRGLLKLGNSSVRGGRVQLDMIRLEVDRGGGQGFVLLATDTTPNYTDTQPLPSTPAKWTYRGMYYVGDQPVGQWSDETSLNVGA